MSELTQTYLRQIDELRAARAKLLEMVKTVEKAADFFSEWKRASAKARELPPSLAVHRASEMLLPWPTQQSLWDAFRAWESALDTVVRTYHRMQEEEKKTVPAPEDVAI